MITAEDYGDYEVGEDEQIVEESNGGSEDELERGAGPLAASSFGRAVSPGRLESDHRPKGLGGRTTIMMMEMRPVPSSCASNLPPSSSFSGVGNLEEDPELQEGLDVEKGGYEAIPDEVYGYGDADGGDFYYDVPMGNSPRAPTPEELPEGRVVRFTCRSMAVKEFGDGRAREDCGVGRWYAETLDRLPSGVLEEILVLLEPVDLCRVARVSHRMHAHAIRDVFWKPLYVERFGALANENFRDAYCTGYKDLFSESVRRFMAGDGPTFPGDSPSPSLAQGGGATPNRIRQTVDSGPEQEWSSQEDELGSEFEELSLTSSALDASTAPTTTQDAQQQPEQEVEIFEMPVNAIQAPNALFAQALQPRQRPQSDDDDDDDSW
ncbi:MAG: F-box protein [archaeon]|nr:F-box protein [archaeon]